MDPVRAEDFEPEPGDWLEGVWWVGAIILMIIEPIWLPVFFLIILLVHRIAY